MNDTGRFRYIGTTNDVVDCENCGKPDLRATVIIVPVDADGNDDGEPCYFGSTCAARALSVRGGGAAVRKAADGARLQTLMNAHEARRRLRAYGLPEVGEPTHDQVRAAVRVFVRRNRNVAALVQETGVLVPGHVAALMARDQADVALAVLVAGTDWGRDSQPLEYGYRSVVAETME